MSVWVEIFLNQGFPFLSEVTLHVSVWVEIVDWGYLFYFFPSHAPRERVSWNEIFFHLRSTKNVTLHVSVWVEILNIVATLQLFSSRSTWACELKSMFVKVYNRGHLSRSTWACELKYRSTLKCSHSIRSRSTWACELKSITKCC